MLQHQQAVFEGGDNGKFSNLDIDVTENEVEDLVNRGAVRQKGETEGIGRTQYR